MTETTEQINPKLSKDQTIKTSSKEPKKKQIKIINQIFNKNPISNSDHKDQKASLERNFKFTKDIKQLAIKINNNKELVRSQTSILEAKRMSYNEESLKKNLAHLIKNSARPSHENKNVNYFFIISISKEQKRYFLFKIFGIIWKN